MSRINWTQVLIFGLVVLVVFFIGLSLLPMLFGGGSWGMGRGGMMGGWCPWCGGTGLFGCGGLMGGLFGLIFTLLGLLIPIGLLGLLIVGGVWLVRNIGGATAPPAPAKTCPGCGRPIEPGWQHCPYCGEEL
ncbi:MAG: zinc ribbon domain-containing protein [Anaerolineae bacterium]